MKNRFRSRKNIFLILTLLLSVKAFSNNYYFSSSLGDDSRTTAQAQNPSTPWKTLSKLNSYFSYLNPGDSVFLKRGDVFTGSIIINKSGTSSAPIVITAYGTGNKPVISGLVSLTNWTLINSGIYESFNSSLGSQVNMVLINDTPHEMGRYPNINAPNGGYLTLQSHSGGGSVGSTVTVTSNQISSIPSFAGGEIAIRANRWTIDRGPITKQTSTTVTYTAPSHYSPIDGFGFFIQNHINTLDRFGEWYYNPSTKKLDVYLGSNNPSSYVIKASVVDNVVSATNASYVTLSSLSIRGANRNGITLNGGTRFDIESCDILYSGYNGIDASSTNNLIINACSINYSNNRGIYFHSSNNNPTISYNTIQNTGTFPGMGEKSGEYSGYIGIDLSDNGTIRNNKIINTGFNAIVFGSSNSIVKNNYIDNFCFIKDDGGGIYMDNGSNSNSFSNRKILNNIILNGIGATAGTNSTIPTVRGIYLDDNTLNVEVTGNTVAQINGSGLFLHNARYITIRNNTLYNNGTTTSHGQFGTQDDSGGSDITNCDIKNNIFFSKLTSQPLSNIFNTSIDNVAGMGAFDSNYYCRPINESNTIKVSVPSSTYYSEDTWSQKYNKDLHSKKTAAAVSDTSKIRFEYNGTNTIKTITLNKTYIDVKGVTYSGSIKLAPYTSIILLDTSTAKASSIKKLNAVSEKVSLPFSIKAQPNPSASYFNISTKSSSNETLVIKVSDLTGRIVETQTGVIPNATFQIGYNLKPGTYVVEAIQKIERTQTKIVKLPH